jgi:hypothetical protein
MSRKDFRLLAETIKDTLVCVRADPATAPGAVYGIREVALELAHRLGCTNPRFDRARFLSACGVE